jgi:hypothetical protein
MNDVVSMLELRQKDEDRRLRPVCARNAIIRAIIDLQPFAGIQAVADAIADLEKARTKVVSTIDIGPVK